jgi:hypothetical protein
MISGTKIILYPAADFDDTHEWKVLPSNLHNLVVLFKSDTGKHKIDGETYDTECIFLRTGLTASTSAELKDQANKIFDAAYDDFVNDEIQDLQQMIETLKNKKEKTEDELTNIEDKLQIILATHNRTKKSK